MTNNVESLFNNKENPHVKALESALDAAIEEIAIGNMSAAEAMGVIEIVKAKLMYKVLKNWYFAVKLVRKY